jgi:uncharacterized protein
MSSSLIEAGTPVDDKTLQDLSPHYTPQHSRIHALDVIKGFAILAGLFVSIYTWGGFSKGMQYQLFQLHKGGSFYSWFLANVLLEDKMRSLIALAFGAGSILLLVRSHPGSRFQNQELLVRRNFFLLLLGIINGIIFLWPLDILYGLGVTGIFFFSFVRMGSRGLFITALVLMLIGCGKIYWHYNDDQKAYSKFLLVEKKEKLIKADSAKLKDSLKTGKKTTDTLTWKQKEEKEAWEGISKKYKWEAKNDSGQIKALQDGRYAKVYENRLSTTQQRESFWFYQFGFWQFASLLILGMALFKIGFFNGRFSSAQYLLIFAICLLAGLLLGWLRMHLLMLSLKDYTKYVKINHIPNDMFRPAEMFLLAMAYASLLVFFVKKAWLSGVTGLLACTGRMALSNYFLQSILMGIIFYGYGMGYYARLPLKLLYFVALEVTIVQLVFSAFWLRYFHMGPLEWVLMSLSKGRRQPFVKSPDEPATTTPELQTI